MTVEPASVLLGRYEVSRIVAQGSMGSLYLGVDQRAGRKVAIKTVRFDPTMTEDERVQLRGWFSREVKALKLVQHPHILQLIDYDEFEEEPYSITEWLDGADLAVVAEHTGPMPPHIVAAIGEQLAGALAAAHAANVIHRDVKPSNAFLTPQGRAVLLDFGLARGMKSRATDTLALSFGTGMVGTPHFMSPEVVTGGDHEAPADVFALGASLYMLATGAPPFPGTSPLVVLDAIRNNDRKPLAEVRRDYPDMLIAAIESMLSVDVDRRPTADVAQQRLRRVLDVSSSVSVLAEFAMLALQPMEAKTAVLDAKKLNSDQPITQPTGLQPVAQSTMPRLSEAHTIELRKADIQALSDNAPVTQEEILLTEASPNKTEILTLAGGNASPNVTGMMTVPGGTGPITDEIEDEGDDGLPVWPFALVAALVIAVVGAYAFRNNTGGQNTVIVQDPTQAADPIALPEVPPEAAPKPPPEVVAQTPPPAAPKPDPAPRPAQQETKKPEKVEKAVVDPPAPKQGKRGTVVVSLAIWANVEVDGLDMGSFQNAFRTDLDAGTHKIVLSNPKYGERKLDLKVKAGETTQVRVDLKQEANK